MGNDHLRSFGQRVRAERTRLGMSQEALADATGLHRTYIGSVERGERNLSLINLLRIAAALDITASDLLLGITAEGEAQDG